MNIDKEKMYDLANNVVCSFLPGWAVPGVELGADKLKEKLNLHQSQTIYDKMIEIFENELNEYSENQENVRDWIMECSSRTKATDFKATFDDIVDEKNIAVYLEKLQDSSMDMENKLTISEIKRIASNIMISMKNAIASDSELFTCWQLIASDGKLESIQDDLQQIKTTLENFKSPKVHTDIYQKDFYKTLCLHVDGSVPHITLDDVFVMPRVKINENSTQEAESCVQEFISSDQQILLLLAHGGYGKSSFVSYMAVNQTKICPRRKMYIIRLREFSSDENGEFSINTLFDRICNSIKYADKIEENAVIVFDGLDELSIITGNATEDTREKTNAIFMELCKFLKGHMNRKIIITSRPSHIYANDLQKHLKEANKYGKIFGNRTPSVQHAAYCLYAKDQRQEFVEKLMHADVSITMQDFGCRYIYELGDNDLEDDIIYGSPFIMYLMCAAKKAKEISIVTEEGTKNRWLLFRQVFHDIYPVSSYDPKDNPVDKHQLNMLYKIVCEMAYRMYKSGYTKNVISRDELKEIVENALKELPEKEQKNVDLLIKKLQQNAALCCYINKKEDGALEFAHNHIRDFFLCEYILHGLNEFYKEGRNTPEKGAEVADWMSDGFKYHGIEVVSLEFLELASSYLSDHYKELATNFHNTDLHFIFDTYCKNGGLSVYSYASDKISSNSASNNVLKNAMHIFEYLYVRTTIHSDEKVKWFDVKVFNSEDRSIITKIKLNLTCADLRNANLRGADLIDADLSGADLSGADLIGANLIGADLIGADLIGANLIGVNLIGADLSDANFSGADLSDTDLSGANLIGADLSGANLSGANLSGANLRGAYMFNADLNGANLSGADLRDVKWGTDISMILSMIKYNNQTKF